MSGTRQHFWIPGRGAAAARAGAARGSVCLLILSLATAAAQPARADLKLCNYTLGVVEVAIGRKSDAEEWLSEGWYRIEPNDCKDVFGQPLNGQFYYVYGIANDNSGYWGGSHNMCVADKKFEVRGTADCERRGYRTVGFQEVDTGDQKAYRVEFRDTGGERK